MAKKPDIDELLRGASARRPLVKGLDSRASERVHLHLYLPADLVRRLREFQAKHHDRWPRLSRLVAEALERFLREEG